ncbi:hypothetical protein [Bacillus sp. Marseille-P3661]|uniref:hypothetical protein n=1 Tax=Bacillus sp. Marseille-P3661 TaxID=1936234 RepID=UPI000C81D845|nr:hypothetical protein [Bacillus sp. Marseille-P3661]
MADVGDIRARITLNTREFQTSIDRVRRETQQAGRDAQNTQRSFQGLESALSAIGGTVAFAGLITAMKATVQEASNMERSLQGLVQVSNALGQSVDQTTALAKKFVDEGLMTMTDAANAVKGSLQMGLDLKQTEQLLRALGDSAAYGRAQHLSLSAAIEQGVQALRLQSSELLDNVGISKNIGAMVLEYSRSVGKSSEALSEAEKNQAIFNAVLKETEIYSGAAQKSLEGYDGALGKFNNALAQSRAEIGEAFLPILTETLEKITPIIIDLAKWAGENERLVLTIGGVAVGLTGLISVITTATFAVNTIRAATVGLTAAAGPAGLLLTLGSLAASFIYMKTTADESTTALGANEQKARELAGEYDKLRTSLNNENITTEESTKAKTRMAEIMNQIAAIAPNVVDSYNSQTLALSSMTQALEINTQAKIRNAAAVTGSTVDPSKANKIPNPNDPQIPLTDKQMDGLRRHITNIEEEKALKEEINGLRNNLPKYTPPKTVIPSLPKVTSSGRGSSRSIGTTIRKSAEDIAREQFQSSLRWIQYKKNLNQLAVDDEILAYERLLDRYSKYNDIRMDMEEQVYRAKSIKTQESFEHSAEWIAKEEQRMKLNGKTEEEITQMKLDAWQRVRNRYESDTEYFKRADQELYNAKIALMQQLEQAQREYESNFKEYQRKLVDSVRDSERDELESIRKRKDAEIESIRDTERAELDSLDRRRQEINDFYDNQLDVIDEQERAEEKAEIITELEKYKYATSKDGIEKYKELQEQLQDIERREQRDHLQDQKDAELRQLDERERNIEDHYDSREREVSSHYDNVYSETQEHYSNLINAVDSYTGNVEGLEQLLANSRVELNRSANDAILDQMENFVDDYNRTISEMKGTSTSASSSGSRSSGSSNGSNSNSNVPSGWAMHNDGGIHKTVDGHSYGVDKDGYVYKNGVFVPAKNYQYIPDEVINAAKDRKAGKYHTGRDGVTGLNFANSDRLLPNEIAAILQDREYVFQPSQLDSLLSAANGGQTVNNYNYNAPLVEHNGDVKLEDDIDVKTYWNERDLLAQRLRAGGERI